MRWEDMNIMSVQYKLLLPQLSRKDWKQGQATEHMTYGPVQNLKKKYIPAITSNAHLLTHCIFKHRQKYKNANSWLHAIY